MKETIVLKVNGISYEVSVWPHATLLEVLREELELTGTKEGCGLGDCGTCTVLMDGKPIASCLTLALQAQGKEILTIEGVSQNGKLHPVQEAFIERGAIQCGFCTPGMVLAAKAFLDGNPEPSEEEAKKAIVGHLCRCTGYAKIVEAIMAASEKMIKVDK